MTLKRQIIIAGLVFSLGGLVLYQNCQGTQTRTAEVDFSSSTTSTWASDVTCALASGSDSSGVSTTWTLFQNLAAEGGSDVLYMDAPSETGSVNQVAPLSYASLRDDGGGIPQAIYAFFALGANGTGALFIGLVDSSGTSAAPAATATPIPSTVVAQKNKMHAFFSKNAVIKDGSTGSTPCTSSNPLNMDAAIAAYNDGNEGLEMANFDDTSFEMQMVLENGNTITLDSYDVEDGDLQGAILLQITESDNNGNEVDYGSINLAIPN